MQYFSNLAQNIFRHDSENDAHNKNANETMLMIRMMLIISMMLMSETKRRRNNDSVLEGSAKSTRKRCERTQLVQWDASSNLGILFLNALHTI